MAKCSIEEFENNLSNGRNNRRCLEKESQRAPAPMMTDGPPSSIGFTTPVTSHVALPNSPPTDCLMADPVVGGLQFPCKVSFDNGKTWQEQDGNKKRPFILVIKPGASFFANKAAFVSLQDNYDMAYESTEDTWSDTGHMELARIISCTWSPDCCRLPTTGAFSPRLRKVPLRAPSFTGRRRLPERVLETPERVARGIVVAMVRSAGSL